MPARVIYHNFQQANTPEPTIVLTAPTLAKGRRFVKAFENINTAINAACLILCGACAGISLFILFALLGG